MTVKESECHSMAVSWRNGQIYSLIAGIQKNFWGQVISFEEVLQLLKNELKDLQKKAKLEVEQADRKDKKRIQAKYDEMIAAKNDEIIVAKEAVWLYEKFGEGEYKDILGLCKVASLTEIEEKGWSLYSRCLCRSSSG